MTDQHPTAFELIERLVASDLQVTLAGTIDDPPQVQVKIGEDKWYIRPTIREALVAAVEAMRDETGLDLLEER